VVAHDALDAVLSRARAKAGAEPGIIEQLRAGAVTLDLLGLDTSTVERASG
jgi:hypothetical protein